LNPGITAADDDLNSLDDEDLFAEFEARYGLKADPLAMEQPFFPDASRQHGLETLRHLCGFGDLALVLTGDEGAGKTRLLAELVRTESSRLDFHPIPPDSLGSIQALASTLTGMASRGLESTEGARDTVYGFFRWSETRAGKGRRMVLLVDDADRIPTDVLRLLLSAYQAADRAAAAAIVFSGSNNLTDLLGLAGNNDGVYQIHLRPLSADEIFAYLEPRVHSAGGDVKALLSAPRLAALHRLSHGSFARLKRVAPAVWLDRAPAGKARRPRFNWALNARWPVLALVVLAGSWWLVSRQYEASVDREENREEVLTKPEPVRKSVTIGPDNPLVTLRQEAGPLVPEPDLPVEPEFGPEPQPEESSPEPEPEPEPEPPFSPMKPAAFIPLKDVVARNGWTIQVIAGNQQQTVINLIAQHESVISIRYTVTERQGNDWYVGFFGNFATRAAARDAISELPRGLRSQSPWIRTLNGF
jgi:DamX protein